MNVTQERNEKFANIFMQADAAGMKAGNESTPIGMGVDSPKHLLDNEIDRDKPHYEVTDGVCGFASVIIKPANSAFANWVKKQDSIHTYKSYYGGLNYPVHYFNQSLTRKEAYASAFSKVLKDNGINSYVDSRMD
ncbi:MAG: hypothetical protein KAS32_24235 [Candidatus Peribacteraceae bacterium]|nr:hypothetical protein [Candidatus Peribacteraceae bacterium]